MAKKKKGLLMTFIVIILIGFFLYWQNNGLQISRYVLEYEELPESFDGYKIVQISDMHGKNFGQNNSTLASRIKALKPDVLLATGDMMSSTINDGKAFINFLDEFGGYCPIYMCLGNHEQIARWLLDQDSTVDYVGFISEVLNRGVYLLDNEKAEIIRGQDSIAIEGLTMELYHYSSKDMVSSDDSLLLKKPYIDDVLGKPDTGFHVLLAHNPAYFHEYGSWGADLILSGHIHGGVIRVPFKGGLLSPDRVFFPEFDAGLFEERAAKMIVNRGLGNSIFNFRLFNRPEISFIELKKQISGE